MDNPETLATPGTQDTGRRQANHKNTTQKTEKKQPMCSRRVSSSCFLKTCHTDEYWKSYTHAQIIVLTKT